MAPRILIALPSRRRLPPIRRIEPEQIDRIASAQPPRDIGARRELRVEIGVASYRPIKELKVIEEGNIRQHILDKERLSPAVVADYDVRNKTLAFELLASLRHGETVLYRRIEFVDMLVCGGNRRGRRVSDQRYPWDLGAVPLSDTNDSIARVSQVANNMAILGGKILVNEQPIHRPADAAVRAASLIKPTAPP
jgi:hypothetical protein